MIKTKHQSRSIKSTYLGPVIFGSENKSQNSSKCDKTMTMFTLQGVLFNCTLKTAWQICGQFQVVSFSLPEHFPAHSCILGF